MTFSPSGRGKKAKHATFAYSRLPFTPTCRRKGDFRSPLRSPPETSFRMILDAGFDPSRLPLPPEGDEKVTREAAFASSRLPFPPQGERKGHRKLSQTPLPETPEAPRKGQPGPPQSSLAMDFIPRGPFSSLSLTVRSLPCFRLGASQASLWSQRVPSFCVAPRLT